MGAGRWLRRTLKPNATNPTGISVYQTARRPPAGFICAIEGVNPRMVGRTRVAVASSTRALNTRAGPSPITTRRQKGGLAFACAQTRRAEGVTSSQRMHENAAPCHSPAAVLTVGSPPDADGLRELGEARKSQLSASLLKGGAALTCKARARTLRCGSVVAQGLSCHQGLEIVRKRKHGRHIGMIRGANWRFEIRLQHPYERTIARRCSDPENSGKQLDMFWSESERSLSRGRA